ncbi:titin isoform X4 [Mangifera indica]|uniref:titin isoform X4 n=1 Tax=Mangifera indica TaxID=29780 RepID=UPI001CFBAD19|nr:titin isoform X4 [Mangifera indica]
MATEAETPEPVSLTKIVGENIYLEKEQSECRVEKGEMQVATGPEAMNTTIEANVETAEGERFLESSSGVEVSCTDTYNESKQMVVDNVKTEVADESGKGGSEIMEDSEEKPEKNDKSHAIESLTGSSLRMAEIEEPDFTRQRVSEEWSIGSHSEVITDQDVPVEDKSLEKETGQVHHNEEVDGNKEVIGIPETKLDHEGEASIRVLDLTVASFNKDGTGEAFTQSIAVRPDIQSDEEATSKIKEGDEEIVHKPYATSATEASSIHEAELKENIEVNEKITKDKCISDEDICGEGSTFFVTKDNTGDTETINALEHSQSGMSSHEPRPENLQQNKPEEEKLERALSVVDKDFIVAALTEHAETIEEEAYIENQNGRYEERIIDALEHSQSETSYHEEKPENSSIDVSTESAETRTSVEGQIPFKSQEESFEKIIKEDLSIHTDADSKNEIPEDKDIPQIELNEKTEGAEVEVPNENATDIHDPHPLIEVAKQTEEINLDKVSSIEPEGRAQEVNEASTEEKYIKDPPEPYQSQNMTIVEHPSTEEEVKTELTPRTNETDIKELYVPELESEEKSVIKGNIAAEKSEEENNTEQIIELESVEQVSVKSLEDEEKKAEEVTGEISDNFKTERAAESIEHEASKTTESPQEIPDTCQVKEEESLQEEEKNLTATESSLEEKIEKNEPEEKLEQPLHLITEKNETFSSEANETPCQMEEGATETLKEAPQKEETEKETEENNDTEGNKTAIEEDLQMLVETSNASESIETTTLEPKTEFSNVVAEDDIKMEDTKELLESCKDTGKNEEAEKWSIVTSTESAETRTSVQGGTPFKGQEESFEKIIREDLPIHTDTDSKNEISEDKDVPEMELNEKIEGAEVEVPNENVNDIHDPHPLIEVAKKTEEINLDKVSSFEPEGRTQEVNDASMEEKYIEDPPEPYQSRDVTIVKHPSIEGEVNTPQTNETDATELESEEKSVIKGNTTPEKSEEESNIEQVVELESVEQVSVKSLEDEERKAEEVTGEISENFETDRAAESVEHEASKTTESPQEIPDTCQVKEEESLQKEENLTATEASLEEKIEKNEPEEKLEQPLHLITEKNETFSSEANETPCQMEEGATETLKEAPQKEETEKETEENNDTEGNKTAIEEDLQMLVETSNASESIETTTLEPKTEFSNVVAEDDIKMEDTKELLESYKDTGKNEEAEKWSIVTSTESTETRISVQGGTPFKGQEESFEKIIREDLPIHTDTDSKNEISEDKDVPEMELNEKIEGAEVEVPNENVNDIRDPHPLIEVAKKTEEINLDKVSSFEPEGRTQEVNDASTEEKYIEDPPEPYQSQDMTIVEHPSIEGEVNTPQTNETDATELESEEKSVIKGNTTPEKSEEESNIEQVIELESVEQVSVKSLEDEERKAEEVTGEISENFETDRAAESIEHEASKTTECPQEIPDTCQVKEEESLQKEEKNLTATESSLEEKIEKNEPEEKLEQPLHLITEKNETFSSEANETPCQMEEGATETLKEALQKEETEKETEENNDTEGNKTAIEEDLQMLVETSNASESIETTTLEPKTEFSNVVAEDDIKMEDTKELLESCKDTGKNEEAEKWSIVTSTESAETRTSVQGGTPFKGQEESFEKIIREDLPIHTDTQSKKEISEDKDVPEMELNEKIEGAEVEVPNENVNDIRDPHPLIEVAKKTEEINLDKVSSFEPEGRTQEVNDASTEEKYIEDPPEPYQSRDVTIVEHPSIEGEVNTPQTNETDATELESEEKSVIKGNTTPEKSEEESNIEQVVELESVEQVSVKSLEDEERKAEEISENFETDRAAESVEHKASKTTESPQEIPDTCQLKEEESLQKEENLTATEASLEEKLEKNEPEEKLEQPLHLITEKNETFSSEANETPCQMEEGATEILKKALQKEETEMETEENNDIEGSKIAIEEDLQMPVETSNASGSIETTVLEPKTEISNMVAEDDIKMEDTKELLESCKDTGKDEEADKHERKEECVTIPEAFEEKTVQCSEEDKKEEEESRGLEVEKIEQSSEEGHTVTNISSELTEQETAVIHPRDTNEVKKPEGENNLKQIVEETNVRDFIPQSVDQVLVKNLENEEKEAKDFTGKYFESETEKTTKSIVNETCKTIESPREIPDTFQEKQGESLQREAKNETVTESSPEEKSLESELTEKLEKPLSSDSNENEAFVSNSNEVHSLKEEGSPQNREEAPETEENEKETEFQSDTKDYNITLEKDDQVDVEISDTSKSIESTILESKAEMENLVVEDDMKKEESKEIYEEFKDAGEVEETQRHDVTEECTTIPAPIGENTVQSSEDDKKEETPKVQACAQHETISLGEDDEKQTQNEENILDRTGELEAEKTEQSSKDDHIVPPILSKSIQHETAETYPGNANEAENPGEEDKQTVEENNIRDCIPESVEQISVKNLKDEENKAEEPTREGFEKSKTEETTENETCETTESPREILDTFQVKQEESSETKELNVTATEPSQVEEPQKNKPEEKTEKPLSSMSYRSEAFNSDAEKLPCQIDEGAPQNLEEAPHEEEHEKETEDNKISMEKDNQAAIETSDPSKSAERTILESRTKMDKMVDEDGTGKEQSEELCEEKESVVEQSREVEVEKTELRSTEEHAIANMSLESIDREAVVISSGNEIKAEESEGKNDVIIEESNIGSLIPEIVEQVSLKKVEDEEKKEHESTGEILDSPKTKEVVDRTKLETGETLESPREILDTFQEKHGESLQSEEDLTTVESSQNLEETPQKQEKENVTEVNNNIEENRIAVEESLQEVAGTSDANTTTESTVPELQTEKDNMVVEDDVKKEESKESYEKSKDAEVEKHEMVEECVNTDILQEITGENSLKSPGADKKEEETSKIELEETGVVKEGADRSRSSECTNILKEPCGEKVHQSSGDDEKEEETSKTEVNSAGEDAEEQFVKEEIMVDQSREEVEKVEQKNKPEEKTESPYSSMSDKNEAFNSDSEKLPCQKEERAPQNVEEASHEEENEKETDDIKIAMEEDNQAVFETSDTSKITERTILEPKTEMDRMVDEDDTGKEQSKELCEDKDVEVAEEKENIVEQSREAEVEKTELSSVEEHAIANMEDEEKKDNESTGEILDRLKTEEVVDNTELETSKTSERPKEILDTFQEKNGESLQSEEKELTTVESSQNLEEAPQKEEKENVTEGKNDIEENRITVEESFQEVAGTSDANKTTESVVLELKTEKDDMVVEEDVKEESKEFYRNSNDAETEKHDMVEECINMDTLQETTGEKSLQSSGVDKKEEETSKIELEETGVVPGAETQTPKGGIDDQSTEFDAQKSEESFKEDYTFGYILPESIEQETVEISPVSVNKKEKSEGKNNVVQVVEESNITNLVPESVEQVPVKNLEEEEKKADMSIEEISDNIKVEEATQSIENETDKNRPMEIPRESLDTFRVKLGESLPSEEKNLTTAKESPPGPQIEESLSDSGKIPCLMEDGASQTEGTLLTAEKENETEDNNQSKDKKIQKEEDPEVVGETSDTSKSAESIVLELKSEMDNRIAEDDIKNEESPELCENFVNPAKVEEIEQRGVSTKEIVQSSEEDKKEEEIPQIEVSSYSEPNRVEKQSRDFEVEKTEQSFKEEHTIANILPQSIEQETAEIHEESENKAEESEGRDRIEQVVEESNIHITESSIEKNPQESEPEEKHEHLLPSTKSDKTEAFISENATMPCQMEEKVAQNLEEASQKEEHMKETDDNKIEVQEQEVQEGVGEKINQSSGDDDINQSAESTTEDDIKNEESQELCENFVDAAKFEEIEQHDVPDECVSTKEIVQSSEEVKKEEEIPEIEVSSYSEPTRVEEQSREFEVEKTEQSFKEEHTVADISPPSIEQEATEIHEKSENKAEESEGKNIAEQEVEESNIDATESSIDKNPQESEPEEKLEHLLPSENDKMPWQMEEKAAQNLEEAPQKEEHMKETDDNKDDKIEAQEQEVQESADRSKSSDFTNISLESTEEKIHQSSRDDKNEEETSKTEASSVGEDAEVQSVKEEDDIESKMPTEESKRTQKVDEDVDAKMQNIEGDRAENNIEASETADFTTSREIQSIVDTKEGLISSTVEDDTVVERSLEDGRKAMKVDELSSAFVEEIEETSSAMEKVSETLKDSEKSNVNSSPREIGECLDEKSSLVPEASEEITEKEEKIIDDSDFASVMVSKEEICLTETEPEGEKQVECQATEKRENIKEDEVPDIRSEDKKDATSDKRPLEETPEEVESSTMTSKEHGIVTGEARETTNLSNVSEVGLVDTDKEPANEEVQKERFEDLYVHSELDKDNPLSVSEGVEISKEEESRELADRTDDCASKTLEDVESSISSSKPEKTEDNPFDEALKTTETYNICADTGKDVLEQEMIEDKEYVEVEKEVIEQKGEAESQRLEDEDTKYTAEEIVKSADRDQILQHPSEAGSGDGSYEMLPETDKNQIEENCSNIKKQEDENEKEEPKLEADDFKEQNANETKKAVILAEETLEEVEQSNDSEVTKEPVLQEEHGISEPHVLSIVGERTYEVLDSSPEYSEYTGTVDSRKKMETESSEVEESSITEREASFSGQSKEQKVEDGGIEPPAELEEKTEEITESSKNQNATFTTETEAIPGEAQLHGRLVEDEGEPCSEKTEESSIREREAFFAGQSKEQKVEDSSMEPPAELEEKIEEITESSKSHSATLTTEAEAVPGEAQLHGRLVEDQGEPCSEKTEESSIREREVSFAGQSKEQKVEDSSIEPPAALEEKIEEITESSKSQNATLKTETEAVPGEAQLHGRLVEDQGEPCSEKTEESSIREREASSAGQSKQQKVEDSSFEPPAELEEKIEEITESSKSHHVTLTAETEAIPGEAQLHGRLVEDQGEPCSEKTEIEYALQGKEVNSMKIEETSSDLTPELQTVEYIVTEEPDETKRASEPFHESKEGTEETELEKCPTVKKLDQFTANDLIHAEKKNEAAFSVVYETQDVGAEGTAKTGESQTIVTTDQVPSTNSEDAEEDSPLVETPNADENEAKVVQEAICESKDQGIEESGESAGVEKLDQVPATNSGDVMKGSVPEGHSEADEVVETEIASIIIPQSREQGTNESDETGKSPTAEKPYTDKSEEACKETSDHGVIGEPCIEPIEKLDQVPATNSEDVMKGSVPEENSEADEVVETERASKIVPLSKEQGTDESNETGKSPAVEETDKDKSEEACEETSEYGVFREQDKEPVEKLDQVPATYSGDVVKRSVPEENSEADGVVETDIASNIVAQSKEQGTNESDETGKSPTAEKPYTDKSEEACKETSDHGVIGEPGIEPIEKLDQVPATNSEDVMKGNVPGENSEADEVVETEIASKIVPLSKEQGTDESYEIGKSPTAEKPDTDESEEASDHGVIGEPDIEPVQKLDQVPATNSRDVIKGSVPEENSEADKVVETDIASNIVPQSKEQGTNESDETGKIPTASKPDTDKSGEACKETSDREVIGEPSFDPVAKGEITAEQTPPAEKLTEWILTQTSELPSEYGATTTVENIEEEKTEKMEKMDDDGLKDSSAAKLTEEISSLKKISRELESSTVGLSTDKNREESPTEVHWEEGQTPDGDIHLEHQEDENKIECLASSSASKDIIDVATETDKACDVNLETSERAFESIQESEFTDMSAEETHSKKTSEANIITEKEVSKEEIKEEKEVAETYQSNSLSEEKLTEGLQEDEQMPGECTGQKTNLTFDTTVGGSLAEELPMVNEKATASKTIIEQVVAEDRSLEHPDRVSVEDKKIKESFPNKFEEINVEESAIKVDSINQDSSENDRTVIAEESSEAILQKENFEGFEKGGKETQKSEETSFVTSEKQVTREECPDTMASTGNEQHVPPVLSEGILETSRDVETEDFTKVVHSEAKEDKRGEEISEESTLVDSNKASLQKLFEKSTRERTQVDEDVKKERDPTGGKEEMQTEEAESHEEEGDEHKKTDSGSDAPVMVEASREMEVKAVTHKKSLLSGVGSKVKHSISKVKKAITGKSTHHHHSKAMSPK